MCMRFESNTRIGGKSSHYHSRNYKYRYIGHVQGMQAHERTKYAALCVGVAGDATGAARVKNAIECTTSAADGSGNMIYSHSHDPGNAAASVRVLYTTASGTNIGFLKIWAAE